MKLWQWFGMLAGTAVLGLLAFGGGSARADDAPLTMVWSAPATTMMTPFYVAEKKGFLRGLKVKEIYISGDANAMRALVSGNADVAAGDGTSNALLSIAAGGKAKIVASFQPIIDFNFIIGKGKGDRIEDMAGKTFASTGPGNIPDVLGRVMLRAHHVDPANVHFITVTGGHAGTLQAVVSGRADAGLVNTVTALQSVQKGQIKIAGRAAVEEPGFGYIYTVAQTSSLADPVMAAKIEKLIEAGIEGSRYTMAHPDEAAAILHEHLPELSTAYLTGVIRQLDQDKVWGTDGGIDPAAAQRTLATYQKAGLIKPSLTVAQAYDFTLVNAALAKLDKK